MFIKNKFCNKNYFGPFDVDNNTDECKVWEPLLYCVKKSHNAEKAF